MKKETKRKKRQKCTLLHIHVCYKKATTIFLIAHFEEDVSWESFRLKRRIDFSFIFLFFNLVLTVVHLQDVINHIFKNIRFDATNEIKISVNTYFSRTSPTFLFSICPFDTEHL